MKLSRADIDAAVVKLSALKFYPAEVGGRVAIKELLARMVDRKERLDWLVQTMIDHVGTWHGTIELRGVYCTRFKPADGIEANCVQSSGFTALDSESANSLEFPKPLPQIEDGKRSHQDGKNHHPLLKASDTAKDIIK